MSFEVGEWVKIKGKQGAFRVTGHNKDGSVALYGGTSGRRRARAMMPEQLKLTEPPPYAERDTKNGAK